MLTLFKHEVKSKRIWQQMMRSCKANRTGTMHTHILHTRARTHARAHTLLQEITDTSWVKDDSFLFKRA